MNIWRTAASLLLAALLGGCVFITTPPAALRVALLAPFEGEHRHIGYNALYAARLALSELPLRYELLAVDDGGTTTSARERAAALRLDPSIVGVVVLGPFSTQPQVQAELTGRRVVIAGSWGAAPEGDHVAQLAPSDALQLIASAGLANEIADFPQNPHGTQFISTGALPDEHYTARYRALSPFAPSPNSYATLVTDAVALLAASHQAGSDVRRTTYEGLNGLIAFDSQGFWIDAPVYLYEITDTGYRVTTLQ
ncbi:MAG: hypothetical protein SNJ80_04115 [Anaerolinea sp.]